MLLFNFVFSPILLNYFNLGPASDGHKQNKRILIRSLVEGVLLFFLKHWNITTETTSRLRVQSFTKSFEQEALNKQKSSEDNFRIKLLCIVKQRFSVISFGSKC